MPIDLQLWRLARGGSDLPFSILQLAEIFLVVAALVAITIWMIIERRSRASVWCTRPDSRVVVVGEGPYRKTSLRTFLDRAPFEVRATSLWGIIVGVVGVVWPVLFIADLQHGTDAIVALLFEAVGMLSALLAIISAIAMLLGRQPFKKREGRLLLVVAFLLSGLCLVHLAHGFDAVEVTAYGIKWREKMKLGEFLVSGFSGIVGGHMGYTWRVLLRTCAIYGLMSSAYFVLYARVIAIQAKQDVRSEGDDKQQEDDEPEGASSSA